MLNEPGFVPSQTGWTEVISGGMIAIFSQRIVKNDSRVLVGETEAYEPRAFRPSVDRRRGKILAPVASGGNPPADAGIGPSVASGDQPHAVFRNHSSSAPGDQPVEDNP